MRLFVNFVRKHPHLLRFVRYLKWKKYILSDWSSTHLFTRKRCVQTPFGFQLISGSFHANQLMQEGTFEQEEVVIMKKALDNVEVFLDVGANIGYYVCLARMLGKHVVAFEPQPQNLVCLLQNLKINNWTDVEVFPLGLGDRVGVAQLFGSSGPSASLIKGWAEYPSAYRQNIPINLLDSVIGSRFEGNRLLVKIDVEGFEYEVLCGATNLLRRWPKPIWFVEICLNEFHPSGINPNYMQTFELFWQNGYQVFAANNNETQISKSDVERWVRQNASDSPVFNYVMK